MPTCKTLLALVESAGHPGVKMSTITTIRADALATLREAAALGLLVTAPSPRGEGDADDSGTERTVRRRSRARRRSERSETAEEATA